MSKELPFGYYVRMMRVDYDHGPHAYARLETMALHRDGAQFVKDFRTEREAIAFAIAREEVK